MLYDCNRGGNGGADLKRHHIIHVNVLHLNSLMSFLERFRLREKEIFQMRGGIKEDDDDDEQDEASQWEIWICLLALKPGLQMTTAE